MEVPSSMQILQMSETLAKLIETFNPTYEDKRLTKGQ